MMMKTAQEESLCHMQSHAQSKQFWRKAQWVSPEPQCLPERTASALQVRS